MAQFLRNFYPPIFPFTGQSRGSGNGTVPVDERKATYRRASFFQNDLPRSLLWHKDVLVTPNKKNAIEKSIDSLRRSKWQESSHPRVSTFILRSPFLSLSFSLSKSDLYLIFRFVFSLRYFILRFDFPHAYHRRWSTIVDRQRHVRSFWSHGRKVVRSNMPIYLYVLDFFFVFYIFFTVILFRTPGAAAVLSPTATYGRHRCPFFLRAAFRWFLIIYRQHIPYFTIYSLFRRIRCKCSLPKGLFYIRIREDPSLYRRTRRWFHRNR